MKPLGAAYPTPGLAHRLLERPPAREIIPHMPTQSFRWLEHDYPSEIARWNYHPELELHLIRKSSGNFIIGDEIGAFAPGHVALIGSGLPHDWMSDMAPGEVITNRDAVVQFDEVWLDRCVESLPELAPVRLVIQESSRGIVFLGETAAALAELIEAVGRTDGPRRVAHMFTLLAVLAEAPQHEKQLVAREWFVAPTGGEGAAAVEAGLAYIFLNLSAQIRMSEAARLAHMSEPTFSKYFKRATGLTFSAMVKKLRIANACRMLDQSDRSVSSISAKVGYTNLANFNRQFLTEIGMTPSAYRALEGADKPKSEVLSLGLTAATATRN